MSNADGALLFRTDGKILAVMLDAEAPAAAYGCFCVSWAVWCEKTIVFVFNDGTASFSGLVPCPFPYAANVDTQTESASQCGRLIGESHAARI